MAIGYNSQGVWTSVTYFRSSMPPGGADYKNETEARAEALRDLRARAPEQLSDTKILSSSDSTGYVAVGRGQHGAGKDENVVGRGKTQRDADAASLAELERIKAGRKKQIVYRYFSYGADAKR